MLRLPHILPVKQLYKRMTALVLGSALLASPLSAETGKETGELLLLNGDKLPASLNGKERGLSLLKITSHILSAPALFDLPQLNSFHQNGSIKNEVSNIEVCLNNKDIIRGTLLGINARSLFLKTPWSERITIKRSLIEGFSIHQEDSILFDGSQTDSPWKSISKNQDNKAWIVKYNNFFSQKKGSVYNHFLTSDKIRLSFNYYPIDYSPLAFSLWSKTPEKQEQDSCFLLTLRPNSLNLNKIINGKAKTNKVFRLSEYLTFYHAQQTPPPLRFDIFIDRTNEKIFLYIDSVYQGDWSEQNEAGEDIQIEEETIASTVSNILNEVSENNGTPNDKAEDIYGSCISLENQNTGKNTQLLTALTIKKWNGVFPGEELLDVPASLREKNASRASSPQWNNADGTGKNVPLKNSASRAASLKMQLVNGDIIHPLIPEGQPESLQVKTNLYTIKVPLDRIMGVRLPPTKDRQRFSKDDIRVYFADNSILTFRFIHANEKLLYGNSESLGNITVDISRIKKIQFNLYNESLKKQRSHESPLQEFVQED